MAGVVRIHTEAKTLKLKPVIGCRIETVEGLAFLAYPENRAAYGRVCRLISAGRMATLDGEWQAKGACEISLAMLADHSEDVHLVLIPPRDLDERFTIAVPNNVVPFRSGILGETSPPFRNITKPFEQLVGHIQRVACAQRPDPKG
jgi:error-prone DNA polymerase